MKISLLNILLIVFTTLMGCSIMNKENTLPEKSEIKEINKNINSKAETIKENQKIEINLTEKKVIDEKYRIFIDEDKGTLLFHDEGQNKLIISDTGRLPYLNQIIKDNSPPIFFVSEQNIKNEKELFKSKIIPYINLEITTEDANINHVKISYKNDFYESKKGSLSLGFLGESAWASFMFIPIENFKLKEEIYSLNKNLMCLARNNNQKIYEELNNIDYKCNKSIQEVDFEPKDFAKIIKTTEISLNSNIDESIYALLPKQSYEYSSYFFSLNDFDLAEFWLRLSIINNYPEALHSFGKLYLKFGEIPTAKIWLQKGADLGSVDSMLSLAMIAVEEEKEDESLKWFLSAANYGSHEGKVMAGLILMTKGNAEDEKLAFEYLTDGANAEMPIAQMALSTCYLEGIGTPISTTAAFQLALDAAQNDFIPAQGRVATLYSEGIGTKKDLFQALKWSLILYKNEQNSFNENFVRKISSEIKDLELSTNEKMRLKSIFREFSYEINNQPSKKKIYNFQHKFIPYLLFNTDEKFYNDLLLGNWEYLYQKSYDNFGADYTDKISILTNENGILIQFPEPNHSLLTYYIFIFKEKDRLRLLTYEKSDQPGVIGYVGEWLSNGEHINHGPRNYQSYESFLADIADERIM